MIIIENAVSTHSASKQWPPEKNAWSHALVLPQKAHLGMKGRYTVKKKSSP